MDTVTDMVREHKDGYMEAVEGLEESHANLVAALDGLLAHLWDGRKRDVKKDYSLMVAEVAARDAIAKARE